MANNYDTTTKFKVDISELKKAMQDAKRQIQIANSEFKAVSSSMDNWSKSTDGISAKLKQLDSNLKSQKTVLSNLEKQYELTVQQMGEGSAEADRLKIAINNQKAVINNTEKEISRFETSLEEVAQAEEIASRTGRDVSDVLEEMDNATENTTGGFTVMKGALASLVADGIRTAISALKDMASAVVEVGSGFSTSMSEVQAISGASADELAMLEATAREFGATTVFSASESADALKYMALAGWDVEQSTSALGGVLNLASASGMGLAQASDMVTDYLSAFSMTADKAGYMADMLSYAQSHANTSAEQLGEAFKNCGANLNASGQDMETTTALLSAMANQGLKGSEAGTALTAVVRDMTAKMKDGAISIGDTSVQVMDAEGNFRDLTDILRDVESATNGMGDAEKATALMSTFTSDSIKGLNLILNDGVDKSAKFEEALRNSSGTAENMSKIMNDNLAGDIKAFHSALEELGLKVYDALEPALRDIIAFVQELATEFNEWLADPATKQAIDELGSKLTAFVEGALTAISDTIKWFIDNKDAITAGINGIVAGIATYIGFTTALQIMKNGFMSLEIAQKAVATAQLLMNTAMSLNPIGILIAVIAGLVVAFISLWNKSEEFRNFWLGLWEGIQSACSVAVEAIKTFFTETIPNAFQSVVDWVKSNWQTLLLFLINPFAGLFKYFYDNNGKFKEFVDNAVTAIKELPSKVWTWLQNTINKVITFVSDMKAKATEAGKGFYDNLVKAVSDLPAKFVEIGSNIVNGIWEGISSGWSWLTEQVSKLASSLLAGVQALLKINSPSKVFADEVGKWIPAGIAVGIDKNAKTALNSIKNLTTDMVGATSQSLGTATGGVTGGVINNFYQTNNSPKALSRLEIYRQSKNLLGYAGGV